MADVSAGPAEAQQSDATDLPVSRFRLYYWPLTDAEKALHDEVKNKAAELEALFELVKPGRYRDLAMTALEESVMWVVKELTA